MIQGLHEELQDQLSAAAETRDLDTDLSFKAMFGGVSGYVQGRVFASLSDIGLALKLSEADQAILLQEPDAPESKQYIVVPDTLRAGRETLAPWVQRSVEYVLSLPAPKPRQKKAGNAKKT